MRRRLARALRNLASWVEPPYDAQAIIAASRTADIDPAAVQAAYEREMALVASTPVASSLPPELSHDEMLAIGRAMASKRRGAA